ncbi:MAG: hypothetical protein HQM13_16765 [SAR324 cluster bacterium]|nr:hypothetical protein [SAR324 cluster bacterium]
MLDLSLMQELSGEEKKWLAAAVVGAAVADHELVNTEVRYVQEILDHLDVDNKKAHMLELMEQKKLPLLPKIDIKRPLAAKVFIYLAQLTVVDNQLSPSEVKFLKNIGQNLGFAADQIREVVSWVHQIVSVTKKEADLLVSLSKENDSGMTRFSMKDNTETPL